MISCISIYLKKISIFLNNNVRWNENFRLMISLFRIEDLPWFILFNLKNLLNSRN